MVTPTALCRLAVYQRHCAVISADILHWWPLVDKFFGDGRWMTVEMIRDLWRCSGSHITSIVKAGNSPLSGNIRASERSRIGAPKMQQSGSKIERSGSGGTWNGNRVVSRLNWPLKFCSVVMLLNLRNAVRSAKSIWPDQSEFTSLITNSQCFVTDYITENGEFEHHFLTETDVNWHHQDQSGNESGLKIEWAGVKRWAGVKKFTGAGAVSHGEEN